MTSIRWLIAASLFLVGLTDRTANAASEAPAGAGVEEITIVARQRSSATDVVQERMERSVAVDLLSSEQIQRVGDTNVASALQRVPGVTVVQGQFVYVRGLGERYSSSLLNSASVPSPDLTRNVIPLDLFPTSIIDSLAVQKAYSPDMPAAFGGGNVDVRTVGVPLGPVASFKVGTGWNADNDGGGLTYNGGDHDKWGTDDGTRVFPAELSGALRDLQGDIGVTSIFNGLRRAGGTPTVAEAETINRELATSLYREIDFSDDDIDPDLSVEGALGNRWYLDNDFEFGAIAAGAYNHDWLVRDRVVRSANNPTTEFIQTERTLDLVTLTGILDLGVRWTDDHEIETSSMYFRNTEDEAALSTAATFNFQPEDGRQLRNYKLRYEERQLTVNQISGTHSLGDATLALISDLGLSWLPLDSLQGLTATWYYSDATADTDVPNEVLISAEDEVDPGTGAVLSTRLRRTSSAAEYRFSELEDEVDGSGWTLVMPFILGDFDGEISGGQDYTAKGREYLQTQFFLGSTSATNEALEGTPGVVLADANILNPANGYVIEAGGIGTESYLAGQITDAAFGKFDVTWRDTWRLSGGARWEQFQQVSVPLDQLEYSVARGQLPLTAEELVNSTFIEDEWYPALALTWMLEDFWAEDFQLRLALGQTVARPDLREISQATYIDPLTEARVTGNPDLVTSELINYDIRAEWFFGTGDNFSVSTFYKDISDPIETVQEAASDNDLALSFTNAESGELYGVEIEWLKGLGFLNEWVGSWTETLFVSGNVTWSDSEIDIGESTLGLTNPQRPMTQHSEWVANVQLGFDSSDGKHSASIAYNVFDERIFFGGRNGAPDFYEQPFQALDLVYTWYPLELLSVRLKVLNLLDEQTELEAGSVTVLEQSVGRAASIDFKWEL